MDNKPITAPSPVVSATPTATSVSPDKGLMDAANEVSTPRPKQQAANVTLGSTNVTVNTSVTNTGGAPTTMPNNLAVGDSNDYWWNTLSNEKAYAQYQTDVNNAVMNSLASRTNIEKNAATAMENFFTEQYNTAQQVDKAGWTGGYVLDAQRQMAYLKATIAADMYNQMELQKEGYDGQLAAARYAYESNQKTLAFEYYQAAVNNALQEAQVTGYYLPPEAKENLNQISMAEKILANPNSSEVEKNKAKGVVAAVNAWFTGQGISKQGIKTLAMLQHEETVRANKENERLQQEEMNNTNLRHAAEMALGYAQIAAQDRATAAMGKSNNGTVPTTGPSVGDTKEMGGKYYMWNGSDWVLVQGPPSGPPSTKTMDETIAAARKLGTDPYNDRKTGKNLSDSYHKPNDIPNSPYDYDAIIAYGGKGKGTTSTTTTKTTAALAKALQNQRKY